MPKFSQIKPAVILCLICLITTGLLALTYDITQEERDRQNAASDNAIRLALFPEAARFEALALPADGTAPEGLNEVYKALSQSGQSLGYLFVSEKRGYGGQVPIMLAVDTQGLISGIRVLTNDETPGLGKKVADGAFLNQFLKQNAARPFALKVVDNGEQSVDAVSGATISSRAVTDAVNAAVLFYKILNQEGQ